MESDQGFYDAIVDPGSHTIYDEGYSNPATIHVTLRIPILGLEDEIQVWTRVSDAGSQHTFLLETFTFDQYDLNHYLEFTGARALR